MTFGIYILSLFLVLLLWLYLKWKSVTEYWEKRGIPFVTPLHPILGSLTFLQRENAIVWFKDLYKKYNYPYLGIWMFWKPALIINTPELTRRILVQDFKLFRNRHISSGANDPIGALNIFTVNDPLWSSIRRRLSRTFSSSKLNKLKFFIQMKSQELCQRFVNEKNNVPVRAIFADFTTDVIGTSAFGVENNATLTGEGPLRTVTKEFMKYSIYRGISWSCIFFFPKVVSLFRFTFFPKSSVEYFRKVYRAIVSQREQDKGVVYNDLLNALMKIHKESIEDGEGYSEDTIIAQAAIILQGGFDTTAVTLTYLFLELAFQLDIQEELYAELHKAKQEHGDNVFDHVTELPFLNSVIKETLRKYPPMGWIDRVAEENYKINDKLTISAGTPVLVNAVGMHHDPKYFPNPEKFNPYRFMPGNEENIKPYTYLPFGDGPRLCIGMKYGLLVLCQSISALILKFKVLPYPNTSKPSETSTENYSMFLMPGEDIYLNFIERS